MTVDRLLKDAKATLESVAIDLHRRPCLHRALAAWLTQQTLPDDILSYLQLQPPPRSYEWVSLAALAEAAGWPISSGPFEAGLEWLSRVALTRVGVPAPVATDSIAQIVLALAVRRRPNFKKWFERVLTHAPSKHEPDWAANGAQIILSHPGVVDANPALQLALTGVGIGGASAELQDKVLDMLLRLDLTDDPLLAQVLLRAMEVIVRSALSIRQKRNLFISYHGKDALWLEKIRVHLKPLERDGLIDTWDDTRIAAGASKWEEINRALARAGTAIFLVSANFLASDFIQDVELTQLLARAEAGGVRILPVIVSPCLFERSALAKFQTVNMPAKPLSTLTEAEQDMVLVDIARTVAA